MSTKNSVGRPKSFAYDVKSANAREKAVVKVLKEKGIKYGLIFLASEGVTFQAKVGSSDRVTEKVVISAPTAGKLCQGHKVELTRGRPVVAKPEAVEQVPAAVAALDEIAVTEAA
jgi:hypothetical protein